MRILALEFSSNQRSVALSSCALRQVVEHAQPGVRGTRAFAMIEQLIQGQPQIDLLAIGLGPGSYTGVRAAISIAQGWQLAKELPVVGVSSMAALALEVKQSGRVHLAVDAHRGEFYLATYEISPAGPKEIDPVRLASAEEIKSLITAGQPVYGPDLPEAMGGGERLFPSASAVARLAAGGLKPISPELLEPIYLRPLSFVKSGPPRRAGQ